MNHVKQDTSVYNAGTRRMSANPIVESLTRTHFLTPVILYSIISVISISYSFINQKVVWYNAVVLYCIGMFFFSFVEYCIHRFLFHFNAETEKEKKIQYNIHGVHHEFPKDKDRLVMPPVISVFLAAFFYFIFRFTMGDFHFSFFAGFIEGYCVYLWIHYAVHRYRTPKNFLKILWHHHSVHHYGRNDSAFAVSMPLWDHVFGTMPKSKEELQAMKLTEKYL
ncbi:MAG: sterol desaturase family protein [Bacteroidia bacterium]